MVRDKTEIVAEKPVPGEDVAVREKTGGRGRTFSVKGEVRYTSLPITDPNSIYQLLDGQDHTLDLEDGSIMLTVLFTRLRFRRNVFRPGRVNYACFFEEKDNPT